MSTVVAVYAESYVLRTLATETNSRPAANHTRLWADATTEVTVPAGLIVYKFVEVAT